MRLRFFREPGAGFRLWRPIASVVSSVLVSSAMTSVLLDRDQMADAVQHAARLLVVLDLDRVPDAAQAEGLERRQLAVRRAVLRLDLRHLDGHQDAASSSAA